MSEMYSERKEFGHAIGMGPSGWIIPEDIDFDNITAPGDTEDDCGEVYDAPGESQEHETPITRGEYIAGLVETAGKSIAVHTSGMDGNIDRGPNLSRGPFNNKVWVSLRQSGTLARHVDDPDAAITDVPVEAVAFTVITDTIPLIPTREPKTGLLGGLKERIRPSEPAISDFKEVPKVITMPDGSRERLVEINYVFDPRLVRPENAYTDAESSKRVRPYLEFNSYRTGSRAGFTMALPESIAGELYSHLNADPHLVRDLMEENFRAHVPADMQPYWLQGNPRFQYPAAHRLKPPYEVLPSGWKLWVVDGVSKAAPNQVQAAGSFDENYTLKSIDFPRQGR